MKILNKLFEVITLLRQRGTEKMGSQNKNHPMKIQVLINKYFDT